MRILVILLIVLLTLSCRAEKTSDSPKPDSGTIEANSEPIDEPVYSESMKMQDDYATALKNWTRASRIPFNEDSIDKIVYGNGRFVATGHMRINFAYSDDGDTWHAVSPNIFGNNDSAKGIAFGNGRFVAAAYGDKIAYSDDGETWTLVEKSHLGKNSIYRITYGNGCFVAVGYNSHQRNGVIGYSNDGETWTLVEDGSLGVEIFYCIAYGNKQFIAGGGDGKAAYSSDGRTWTVVPGSPFEDKDVRIITYGNGRFVAFCSYFQGYNPLVTYSDDGINWRPVAEPPFYRYPIYNIVYANGIFIAVSHSARMAYSFNGETWYPGSDDDAFIIRPLDLEGGGDNLGGIAYGNNRFVIGRGNGGQNSSRIAWCEMPAVMIDTPLESSDEDETGDYTVK